MIVILVSSFLFYFDILLLWGSKYSKLYILYVSLKGDEVFAD